MNIRAMLARWRVRCVRALPGKMRGVLFYPPGHFYSPLLDPSRIDLESGFMDGDGPDLWACVELDRDALRRNYERWVASAGEIQISDVEQAGWRYFSRNDMFPYGDAFVLASLLRERRPRRVVEVGSGFSSAMMLDTAEAAGLDTRFTFIEIRPQRLNALLRPEDRARVSILQQAVQSLGAEVFAGLEAGDILFIDSSHVAKVGSDVAHLFLGVLPLLARGVLVHVHDIFFPRSYPAEWLRQGRAWNESLFLRAFLAHNRDWRVIAFNGYAAATFPDVFAAKLPRFLDECGGSFWFERVG